MTNLKFLLHVLCVLDLQLLRVLEEKTWWITHHIRRSHVTWPIHVISDFVLWLPRSVTSFELLWSGRAEVAWERPRDKASSGVAPSAVSSRQERETTTKRKHVVKCCHMWHGITEGQGSRDVCRIWQKQLSMAMYSHDVLDAMGHQSQMTELGQVWTLRSLRSLCGFSPVCFP